MKWTRTMAACVLLMAMTSLASAAGDKVEIPVTDGGIVKVKPVCEGEEAFLEVEVEVKGVAAGAACAVSVASPAGCGTLPAFTTDDEGEGETEGDVLLIPVTDVPLPVTITITCGGGTPIVVATEVAFEKPCEDD